MKELIQYFNDNYGSEYGNIDYPRTKKQIYSTYQIIKEAKTDDKKLKELLENINLPTPKTIEEKDMYSECINSGGSYNDLSNKPFYETPPKEIINKTVGWMTRGGNFGYTNDDGSGSGLNDYFELIYKELSEDKKYEVIFNEKSYICDCKKLSENTLKLFNTNLLILDYEDDYYGTQTMLDLPEKPTTPMIIRELDIKQLEKKFIPKLSSDDLEFSLAGRVNENNGEIFNDYFPHIQRTTWVAKGNVASGNYSHAEGGGTTASGNYSHAEGYGTTASGENSHAEGYRTTASGENSTANGDHSTASGENSTAIGLYTTAQGDNQLAIGKFNTIDTMHKYAFVIGGGRDAISRGNIFEIDWKGNAWYKGKLSQEGTPTEDKDLTTKKYVDDKFNNLSGGGTSSSSTNNLIKLNVESLYSNSNNSYYLTLTHEELNNYFIRGGYLHFIISTTVDTIDLKVPIGANINKETYNMYFEDNPPYFISASGMIGTTSYVFDNSHYHGVQFHEIKDTMSYHIISLMCCAYIKNHSPEMYFEMVLRDFTGAIEDCLNMLTVNAVYYEECNFPME